VQAAAAGRAELLRYLLTFDRGARAELFVGTAAMKGRFFYDEDLSAFNFSRAQTTVRKLLQNLGAPESGATLPPIYSGSTPVAQLLPGFEVENQLDLANGRRTEARIWIGNASRVAPHFDETENIACVVQGRRRFVLFPPDQVANLYVGPLDFTMAGQPASMVDLTAPDFDRYPRFRTALKHALVADLGPGDAIYIPAMWWHGVEAQSDFNILVNYWWGESAPDAGSPFPCLAHGIMTMSDLPQPTREAWRAMFDHFVFQKSDETVAHLPLGRRGIMERQSSEVRGRIRQFLLKVLGGG